MRGMWQHGGCLGDRQHREPPDRVLDRSRQTNTVVTVTGNQADQVSRDALGYRTAISQCPRQVTTYLLCPHAELSDVEATQELELAVKRLRRDRARPIEVSALRG